MSGFVRGTGAQGRPCRQQERAFLRDGAGGKGDEGCRKKTGAGSSVCSPKMDMLGECAWKFFKRGAAGRGFPYRPAGVYKHWLRCRSYPSTCDGALVPGGDRPAPTEPAGETWKPAGRILLGDTFSLAWRCLNAQYWG